MKDSHSGQKVVATGIFPKIWAADSTVVTMDRQGYESAELVLDIGIGGITFDATNKIEFKLQHSDDDSSYSNVADGDMKGVPAGITSGIIKSLIAAHAAETVSRFGYIGGKRYLQLLADFSGTHGTGTGLCALLLLGNANVGAVADQT